MSWRWNTRREACVPVIDALPWAKSAPMLAWLSLAEEDTSSAESMRARALTRAKALLVEGNLRPMAFVLFALQCARDGGTDALRQARREWEAAAGPPRSYRTDIDGLRALLDAATPEARSAALVAATDIGELSHSAPTSELASSIELEDAAIRRSKIAATVLGASAQRRAASSDPAELERAERYLEQSRELFSEGIITQDELGAVELDVAMVLGRPIEPLLDEDERVAISECERWSASVIDGEIAREDARARGWNALTKSALTGAEPLSYVVDKAYRRLRAGEVLAPRAFVAAVSGALDKIKSDVESYRFFSAAPMLAALEGQSLWLVERVMKARESLTIELRSSITAALFRDGHPQDAQRFGRPLLALEPGAIEPELVAMIVQAVLSGDPSKRAMFERDARSAVKSARALLEA